jgi:hypothetical protein
LRRDLTRGRAGERVRAFDALDAHTRTAERASTALGIVRRPDGLAEIWIVLAGTIAVPWPLPDRPPVF